MLEFGAPWRWDGVGVDSVDGIMQYTISTDCLTVLL